MKSIKLLWVFIMSILALYPSLSAAAPPMIRGMGITQTDLNSKGQPEIVMGWLESEGYKTRLRVQVLYNVNEEGVAGRESSIRDVATVPGLLNGAALASGQWDKKPSPDLLFAWSQAKEGKGGIFYRAGMNMNEKGEATWSKVRRVPGKMKKNIAGLGASVCHVDQNGYEDIVLAWAESEGKGYEGKYRVGYDIKADGSPKRWGDVRTVGNGSIRVTKWGIGVECADLDNNNKRPELVFSWLRAGDDKTPQLAYRIGKNLDAEGNTEDWTGDLGRHDFKLPPLTGGGMSITKSTRGRLTLFHSWASEGEKAPKLNLAAARPVLARPVAITKEDLETVGDSTTGFSVAAVKSQLAAGIKSPRYLVKLSKQFVKNPQSVDELTEMVNQTLDAVNPPLPEEVRPEMEDYLLKYYGVRGGTGL